MNRLFGAKPKGPKPTLTGAISNIDDRIASIDVKLASLEAELVSYQQRLTAMRDGPGKEDFKRKKVLPVLRQRRQYEAQREKLRGQVWNMEQAQDMQDNLRGVMATVDALQETNKALKKEYGKVDIDKIERLQDEMADLMDVGHEIQASLGRSYDVPEDYDETELDAELEALGAEMDFQQAQGLDAGGAHADWAGLEGVGVGSGGGGLGAYLQDEVPKFVDEAPTLENHVKEVAR